MASSKRSINLLRGWPSPSLLPLAQLHAAADVALSNPSVSIPALLYGPDEGYGPLRTEISTWLSSFYDCPDDPSRICITGGASQNLACILQAFADPAVTQRIWMVTPCYFLACRIFEDAGFAGRLRAVPEDEDGIDVEFLEREIIQIGKSWTSGKVLKPDRSWRKTFDHIVYTIPDFSNPSGKTVSLSRREMLVAVARKHNALVITDDVYDRLHWPSASDYSLSGKALVPRVTDIDRALPPHHTDPNHFGHTLSNGSFSKILGPGLRTGWADCHPTLSYGLSQVGSSHSGGCPSQLVATMITELIRNGQLQEHIDTVLIPSYERRWRKMIDAIEMVLVPLGIEISTVSLKNVHVFGGYFIWFKLPREISAETIAIRAKEQENLIVGHGNLFEVDGDEDAVKLGPWIRVCFAWEDEDMLVLGIARLGRIVRDSLTESKGVDHAATLLENIKLPLGEF